MIKKLMLASAVGLALAQAPMAASAANTEIYLNVAPPPPRVEVMPPPRRGYIWVPGYWQWRGHHHIWIGGMWVRERRDYDYRAPVWVQRGDRWYLEQGRWERREHGRGRPHDRDHDGVPDRYDARPNDPYRR